MIRKNAAQCLSCKDIIESTHRHDFVTCSCFKNVEGNTGIFIDGGLEYFRRGGNFENFKDLSIPSTPITFPKILTEQEVREANKRADFLHERRDKILAELKYLVGKFLYYDRSEEGLSSSDISDVVSSGLLSLDDLAKEFRQTLNDQFYKD